MTTAAASDAASGGAAGATSTGAAASGQQSGGQAQAVEYKFSAVEGVPPEFDADIAATAKEMGWDLPTAEKFRAREIKLAQDDLKAQTETRAQKEAADKIAKEQADTQRRQAWEKANRDDPEFGGQKYHETSQRVEQMFAMAGERGKALMKEMGDAAPELISNPAFRNFLAFFAYKMADAKFHEGKTGHESAQPKTFADVAYGDRYSAAAR